MAMAYDVDEEIKVVRNGQAVEAQYPIPPGVVGHDPNWKSRDQLRSRRRERAARQVRLQEGRRRLAHAARRQAAGGPVRVAARHARPPARRDRGRSRSTRSACGWKCQKDKFPELLKLEKQCKLHDAATASWIADYPDGDNFMQLLYGPNTCQSNNACAKIPEYDKLYEQTQRMPPGPERDRLYQEMTRIIEAYAPWRLTVEPLPQPADPAARAGLSQAPDPALGVAVHLDVAAEAGPGARRPTGR